MIRTAVLGLAASMLLAGVAEAQQKDAKDPIAEGKPLSYWVNELLHSDAPQTRNAAAYAISSIGPAAAPAVPALIHVLADSIPNTVRYPAIVALREIGPPAKAAVPALRELLADRNDEISHMAEKALKKITPEDYE